MWDSRANVSAFACYFVLASFLSRCQGLGDTQWNVELNAKFSYGEISAADSAWNFHSDQFSWCMYSCDLGCFNFYSFILTKLKILINEC